MTTRPYRPAVFVAVALAGATVAAMAQPSNSPSKSSSEAKPAHASPPPCTWQSQLDPAAPGSPSNLVKSAVNPNGDSELALLMRAMEDDVKRARQAIVRGNKVPAAQSAHRKMPCAWPTDLRVRSAAFDAFAAGYSAAWTHLEAAPSADEAKRRFGAVISACVGCHEQFCHGPIARIEGLGLPAVEPNSK